MTIDFWGLGLQAVNVLILIWLLSRIFWRPVAAAIAKRQEVATSSIEAAKATQTKAEEALGQATQARAGIAAERTAMLDAARNEATIATKVTLAEARTQADAILETAKMTAEQDNEAMQKTNENRATDLAMIIAARLLERLNSTVVQSAFLSQLVEAIAKIPPSDLAVMLGDPKGLEIVTATATGTERTKIEQAVQMALGGKADLKFVTDPDLIAGLELRTSHFVLHNSWQADLQQVEKAVRDAA